jgi:hypothetical protein
MTSETAQEFRGSQRHLLDLISHPNYVVLMNDLLAGVATITNSECRIPTGHGAPNEWELPQFISTHCAAWLDVERVRGWWLPTQPGGKDAKGATWDLLSTCRMNGQNGLLLVEAKAHESELSFAGKALNPAASDQSKLNHAHIAGALQQANRGLRALLGNDASLRIDSHYQLANRLAWAWKLAECGVPVVLLYLGFTGDTYFNDHFKDGDHWQRAMGAYMSGVVPSGLPGRTVGTTGRGSFVMLVKDSPVSQSSPVRR